MKKIKLSFKNMEEVLSRDELKRIVGGFSSGGGSGYSQCDGLEKREVCCKDDGELGECVELLMQGCSKVVSKTSPECPKE